MKKIKDLIDWDNRGLQVKLLSIFAFTLVFIIAANAVMFVNVNSMLDKLDRIYVSNLNLDGLLGALEDVQSSMTEYLDTKSSDSLDKYYRATQSYRGYLDTLNTDISSEGMLLSEKNIYNLSLNYLDTVEDTINAKRGRDVEQYSQYYEEADNEYRVVETFIYSLNNARFRANNRDYNVLLTSLKTLEAISLSMLIVAIILDIILMFAFTGNLIKPLRDLSEAAKKVSEGDFGVEVETVSSDDEIGILSKTFSQMLKSIRDYVERLGESIRKESAMKEKELMMESQVKDAQLKVLQAQINPHFLFNTLNAGAQLAMMEGADKTTVFIDNMASFFRYNISRGDEDTTLGEELALVDNYIYILNVRFSGEIHYKKNIDESLLSVKVPSMILQPLVENSVNYGIRDIDGEKIIEVSTSMSSDGNSVELSVWDNGHGMSEERIREVLTGDYEPDTSASGSNGVGLNNVRGRLELFFGRTGLMDIKSDGPGTGTEVIIRLPLE